MVVWQSKLFFFDFLVLKQEQGRQQQQDQEQEQKRWNLEHQAWFPGQYIIYAF
jgi:hypothetical protein